jgi:predicted XRE-type DNA-binding protein
VTPADGNIFADIGFPPEEAENRFVHASLSLAVEDLIRSRKLTQAEAAKLLGVTQPRVSDLLRGKRNKFSVDALISMLGRAGMRVRVDVRPKAA